MLPYNSEFCFIGWLFFNFLNVFTLTHFAIGPFTDKKSRLLEDITTIKVFPMNHLSVKVPKLKQIFASTFAHNFGAFLALVCIRTYVFRSINKVFKLHVKPMFSQFFCENTTKKMVQVMTRHAIILHLIHDFIISSKRSHSIWRIFECIFPWKDLRCARTLSAFRFNSEEQEVKSNMD